MTTCQNKYEVVNTSKPVCLSLIYPSGISKNKDDLEVFKSYLSSALPYSAIYEHGKSEPGAITIISQLSKFDQICSEESVNYFAEYRPNDCFDLLVFSQESDDLINALALQDCWQSCWDSIVRLRELKQNLANFNFRHNDFCEASLGEIVDQLAS